MSEINIYHKTVDTFAVVEESFFDNNPLHFSDYQKTRPQAVIDAETEYLAKSFRAMRDAELKRTDTLMFSDRNPSEELITYRQQLRDAPSHPGWPHETPQIMKWSTGLADKVVDE